MSDLLRHIPQIQGLLDSPPAATVIADYSRDETANALRAKLDCIRADIRAGHLTALPDFSGESFFADIVGLIELSRRAHLRPVVNATGIVIHTNLGRAPLAEEALDAIRAVAAGYSNLEYDLEAGTRGSRYTHVENLICELTGAEAAIVVNNCAAAVILCLSAFARDKEVITSRGELIEIGGSFRLPDVIAQSGAQLREVGATNKTRLSDYRDAITESTAVLLKSHTSNFRIVGFTAQPERAELAALAKEHDLVLMEDLGSGVLIDLAAQGLPDEPVVGDILATGVDVVTFSGDKLLGGPQAGVIAGRAEAVNRLRKHPLLRALRIDKLSLAALEATLRLYRAPNDPIQKIPVLRMLARPAEEIMADAEALAARINSAGLGQATAIESVAYAGGGSLPQQDLKSAAVALARADKKPGELAEALRAAPTPIIGRIVKETFQLDMRTVAPHEPAAIEDALRQIAP